MPSNFVAPTAQCTSASNALNSPVVRSEKEKSSHQPRHTHIIITSRRTCCPVCRRVYFPLFIIYPKTAVFKTQWMKKVNNKNNETHRETINCRRLVIESPFLFTVVPCTSYNYDLRFGCIQMHTRCTAHTVIILISLLSLKFSNLNGSQQPAAPSDAS